MKDYYRLQLLKSFIPEKDFRGLVKVGFKMARSKVFGGKRLVFGLRVHKPDSVTPVEIPGFKLELFKSWESVDDTVKKQLAQSNGFIIGAAEAAVNNGAWLWAGYCDEELTNIILTTKGDNKRLFFPPLTEQCVVISHSFTLPKYRRFGFYTAGLIYIVNELAKKGCKVFYIDCLDYNVASIQAIEAAGFSFIGEGKHNGKQRLLWHQKTRPCLAKS